MTALPAVQQLGATLVGTSAGASAAFWQLAFAFLCGGLFFSTAVTAAGRLNAYGSTNIAWFRRMVINVVRRTWRIMVTMLGAASMTILGRNLPGAPCLEDECDVGQERGRWAEAWAILR